MMAYYRPENKNNRDSTRGVKCFSTPYECDGCGWFYFKFNRYPFLSKVSLFLFLPHEYINHKNHVFFKGPIFYQIK